MFKGKTAWFSGSVGQGVTSFWVSEGGALSSWRTADYLFSADASSEDTERIYESEDYVENRATVFHSNFVSACKPRQSVKSVPIGHYVLPPASIQNELRVLIGRFIWETDEQVMSEEQINTEESEDRLSDKTKDQPGTEKKSQDDYETVASPIKVCSCCETLQYPVNNMISGYVHIDQMKKYSGELYDFLPSLHGHNISRSNDVTPPHCHKEM
ncbi:telomere repeats-binding bouquet formation protein 2-like [Cyprinus carpio]|uniref:Telomere repeats-binding bouquet formation protein 2-like n=2 Tax=Cyprinus carpio TaxID=7962 RepID=A0A8C1WTL8_CYPCA|nr:telomere repeats-binding bouquet formation protein 2-like [Cyprinus carpio]XP_042616014.1 telomere repeats-binding bouquet formation protein 2-like [Cyprinus carpio]